MEVFIKSTDSLLSLKDKIVKYSNLQVFLNEDYAQNCPPRVSFNGIVSIST